MKRIKTWWNGKEVLVNDGGYAPRLELRMPWARTFYEKDKTGFWSVVTIVTAPFWLDLYTSLKTYLFH